MVDGILRAFQRGGRVISGGIEGCKRIIPALMLAGDVV
jgi:hypothetical protein